LGLGVLISIKRPRTALRGEGVWVVVDRRAGNR